MDSSTLPLSDISLPTDYSGSLSFVPSLQILFHGELSRIGESTAPQTFASGQWLALGRLEPNFQAFKTGQLRPLADPYISRGQAAIRWDKTQNCFEVKPSSTARLAISVIELRRGESGAHKKLLTEQTTLPPGTLISIGDRIMLLLRHQPWHAPTEDRLGMVGESDEMWNLRQLISDIAGFDSAVLILGETGVGKELVSQALHTQSKRTEGPFVPTNCAALPEQLIESLLFGHQKGAFTGAKTDSTGLFVTAKDGTLFLDEIGEMPMSLQAKLLRVLQEKVVVPVGSKRGIAINTRVIAATNRLPDHEIEAGRLRSDLYYRLSAHVIKVPKLHERFLDVPLLFLHFLTQTLDIQPSLAWLWSTSPPSRLHLPMSFFIDLLRYPWKGNVRELQNIAEQTARLNLRPGPFTAPEILSPTHTRTLEGPSPLATKDASVDEHDAAGDHELVLRAAQKLGLKRKTAKRLLAQAPVHALPADKRSDAFLEALQDHIAQSLYLLLKRDNFNQTHAADALGVARGTLINLMKRFGLRRAQEIGLAELKEVYTLKNGELEAIAQALRVSPASLKTRLQSESLTTH